MIIKKGDNLPAQRRLEKVETAKEKILALVGKNLLDPKGEIYGVIKSIREQHGLVAVTISFPPNNSTMCRPLEDFLDEGYKIDI